jgi:hypothetical protein
VSGRCNNCLEPGGEIRMWGAVHWCRRCCSEAGEMGRRAMVRHDYGENPERFTPDVLKKIANGPIMDSSILYLPAGKLSKAEADARERAMIEQSEPPAHD